MRHSSALPEYAHAGSSFQHSAQLLANHACSIEVLVLLQVAAQVKQLEMKLITLRQELAERERQARQAEFTVRDLKLELDNLQVCMQSCQCLKGALLTVV